MAPYRVHSLNLTYITQQALLKAPPPPPPPPPYSQALVWSDLGSYESMVQNPWGAAQAAGRNELQVLVSWSLFEEFTQVVESTDPRENGQVAKLCP